jgi:hypothetical protein
MTWFALSIDTHRQSTTIAEQFYQRQFEKSGKLTLITE